MNKPEPTIRVNVDPTNPGHFFACCGLLELADRLWEGAEGWFEGPLFIITCGGTLKSLIEQTAHADLVQLNMEDDTGSPVEIGQPFRPLRLDWWQDSLAGGKQLKIWAGTMESFRIARAMQSTMKNNPFHSSGLLDVGMVAFDPDNREKKVEPFYFDARRGPNAHSRDVGFSPNDLQMTTSAFPAVEFLCLVGLQRCLPIKTTQPRVFDYFTWSEPLPVNIMAAAVTGSIPHIIDNRYRFENWFRTGQKKHKAFRSAILIPTGEKA